MDKRILEVSLLHRLVPPGTENSLLIWDLSDIIVQPSQSILTLIDPCGVPMHRQLTEDGQGAPHSPLPPQLVPAPAWNCLHQPRAHGCQKDHPGCFLTTLPGSFGGSCPQHPSLPSCCCSHWQAVPLVPSLPHGCEQVKLPCAAALQGRRDSPALHEVIPVQHFVAHIISLQPPWKLKAGEFTIQELGEKESLEEGMKG